MTSFNYLPNLVTSCNHTKTQDFNKGILGRHEHSDHNVNPGDILPYGVTKNKAFKSERFSSNPHSTICL